MQGASDEIKRQARRKLFEHGKAIEDARTLKQRCEEAGVKV
jgi:predicted DsbA family dithiol-disulfide isomerase